MVRIRKKMTEKLNNIDGSSGDFLTNLKGFLGKKLRSLELQQEEGGSKNLARSFTPFFLVKWGEKKRRSCYCSKEVREPGFTSTTTTDTDDELLKAAETLLLLKGAEITSAETKQIKRYCEFEAWEGGEEVEAIRPIKKKKVVRESSFTGTTTAPTDADDKLLEVAEALLLLKGAETTSAEEIKTTFNFNPSSVMITSSDIIPTKKQRKRYREFEAWRGEEEVEVIRKIKKKKVAKTCSRVDPILPEEFRIRIRELIRSTGGFESEAVVFVYEKKLFQSDVKPSENRLLMPLKQLNDKFLTEEEKRRLRTPDHATRKPSRIEALLIQPCLEECRVNFKKWDMGGKATGKLNENYVLVTTWNQIVKTNKLNVGTIVQLWSFRTGEGQLCFALVKKET